MAIEDVVTEHQGAGGIADKLGADDEGLCEPIRTRLHGVLQVDAPLATVAQQLFKTRRVLRRRDDQDVQNAGQHQRGQRVKIIGLS
jgi:hypothetical protein